jgi:glyoxylase-like metal-dependent hydrolase (beta-lactamase superfamily II)
MDKMTVGKVEVISFSDCVAEIDACNFFSNKSVKDFEAYGQHIDENCKVRGGINVAAFLVVSGGRRILVDVGVGPGPVAAMGNVEGKLPWVMKEQGVDPESIDVVVATHLHFDHIGWMAVTSGGKVKRTFPKAKYIAPRIDWELLREPSKRPSGARPEAFSEEAVELFVDKSRELGEGLAKVGELELVEGKKAVTAEVELIPTPGHTPGHQSLMITSAGERGFILGDVAHLRVQLEIPDWEAHADVQPELGRKTRRETVEWLEKEGIKVAAGHFPAPGFGRIVRGKGRRYWQAL